MWAGRTLNDANLANDREIFHSMAGPGATGCNPAKKVRAGDYRGIGDFPTGVVRFSDGEESG